MGTARIAKAVEEAKQLEEERQRMQAAKIEEEARIAAAVEEDNQLRKQFSSVSALKRSETPTDSPANVGSLLDGALTLLTNPTPSSFTKQSISSQHIPPPQSHVAGTHSTSSTHSAPSTPGDAAAALLHGMALHDR